MVAMAHPDRALPIDKKTVEQRPRLTGSQQIGMTELTLSGRHDLAAEMTAHQLHAVADAQHRHTQLEQLLGNRGSPRFVDRLWPAGENDPGWRKGADRRHIHVKRMQFAEDMGFTHPAGDKLGVLGTEIENQDFLAVDIWHT